MVYTLVRGLIGLILLLTGAEMLVRGSSRLAVAAGIPPLIVGLTIVGFGTSSPELAISVRSALTGEADIALGNAVGSNIFNVLVILGLSAAIVPLVVSPAVVRREVPIMIGVSFLLLLLAFDGSVSRWDGLSLIGMLGLYLFFQVWQGRRAGVENGAARRWRLRGPRDLVVDVVLIGVGLLFLAVGADWLVNGAVALARMLGISELIIALTIVAGGTGLPEAVTSLVATLRHQRDIAVGNVIGSNIFNILCVIGLASVIAPNGLSVSSAALSLDMPIMLVVSLACLPVFFTGYAIARWEGAIFLLYYALYVTYLLLAATQHDVLQTFSTVTLLFIIPLTVITFLVLTARPRSRVDSVTSQGKSSLS